VFDVLRASLSAEGLDRVSQIVRADEDLAQGSGSAGLRGGVAGWSEDNYWIALFGTPSAGGVWAWQFGGTTWP